MIANKRKENKTGWLCVDGFTLRGIELIQFLERSCTIDCLNVASVDIDKTISAT
jgi:coenzyme F420-reducing hydrogenase beta subunit